jgi:ammonium transporter, Amt family
LVFAPISRWIWGDGMLSNMGVIDYAGGLVVCTAAGVSAIVVSIMIGKREGFGDSPIHPHSPGLALAGAAMLWVGWMAMTGGASLSADDLGAGSAMINSHVSACVAALTWILMERLKGGKPTAMGFAHGALCGLAAVAAGADVIGPGGAFITGIIAAILCQWALVFIRDNLKIDDAMNIFAVFGLSGILGTLLAAVFASEYFGGFGYEAGSGIASQLFAQVKGIGIVGVYAMIVTLIIGHAISFVLPMRVSKEAEADGLDIASHGERAWGVE